MTLKEAAGWSVIIHLGLMMVKPAVGMVPSPESLHTIEVTYLSVGAEAARIGGEGPVHKAMVTGQEAASGFPTKPMESTPVPPRLPEPSLAGPKPSLPSPIREEPAPRPSVTADVAPVLPQGVPLSTSQGVTSLPEGEFAVVFHKQQVRLHLKRHLIYPATLISGTVRLRLSLRPDGALKEAVVLQASDSKVRELALEGVRSAEPFPRFPKELKSAGVQYEFLVQYRYD